MTVEAMINKLSELDQDEIVIIRQGDSLNVDEIPAGGFTQVSYCEAWEEIISGYTVNIKAERKKCSGCCMANVGLCIMSEGIGQYMRHAYLIDGGNKRDGVPSFNKEYKEVMAAKCLNYVTGTPFKGE